MNICKNPEDGLNFLEVHWLESESSDGAVQVTEVIHLEYIKPLPPFVVLDAEDAFDFAPTSIFFRISFENGYITLYADCSAFGIEIGKHIDQTSKQAENKQRSAPPSNEVSGKTCQRTANDKGAALIGRTFLRAANSIPIEVKSLFTVVLSASSSPVIVRCW